MDAMRNFDSGEARLVFRAKQLGLPLSGSMELLPLCNLNCRMCYVRLSRSEMEAKGRLRSGAEWLELGRQMANAGTLFLLLTGGEPLLHPDFKEIYLGLKKMGMILTINTNGTLIDETWADFFAANKPRRINITLYGADGSTYARQCGSSAGFDHVMEAVKLLRNRDVDVKLSGSLTPEIAEDLPRMAQIARELKVPLHVDPYMMPASRERDIPFNAQSRLMPEAAACCALEFTKNAMRPEEFLKYRQELLGMVDCFKPSPEEVSQPGCLAGHCGFTVSWQGSLQPCEVLTEPAVNVFDTGFEPAWETLRKQYQTVRYCGDCGKCRLQPLCSSCPAACLLETGDYMKKPEYLCRYAAEYERLLRLSPEEDCHE